MTVKETKHWQGHIVRRRHSPIVLHGAMQRQGCISQQPARNEPAISPLQREYQPILLPAESCAAEEEEHQQEG